MTAPAPVPVIQTDRLYGISYRPQELGLYGERVNFSLRCAPVFDDPDEVTATHYRLLVLEITADLPADDELGRGAGPLQLLKIGWELTLLTAAPQQVGTVPEAPGELERLLGRIADTVNDLARRAGLEAPMGPDVVTQLVVDYRLGRQVENDSQE
jgi:hypothetical protein